jgi:hypothetical protein
MNTKDEKPIGAIEATIWGLFGLAAFVYLAVECIIGPFLASVYSIVEHF